MNTFRHLMHVWIILLLSPLCSFGYGLGFSSSHAQGSTVSFQEYTDQQTAYIDCSETSVNVFIVLDQGDGLKRSADWSVSANYSYYNLGTFDPPDHIRLNLDANRNNGYVTINYGGVVITVYIVQKSTPTFTITPTLCSAGQSGDFSVTLNYYGPNTANVVWETTGGILVNGGTSYRVNENTISRATIQHNSFGTVTVYGEVPGCNNMQTKPATYYIGTPSGSDVTFSGTGGNDPGSAFCSGQMVNFQSSILFPGSQFTYDWSVPQGSNNVSYFYGSGPNATVGAGSSGGFILQMGVTNTACNTTGYTSRTFGIRNCNGSFRMAANPASDNLTAIFEPVDDVTYLPSALVLTHEKRGTIKELKVREKQNGQSAKNGFQVSIDVKGLPSDTYYLQGLYDGNKVQTIRVLIQ